jgi:hypothetical protein
MGRISKYENTVLCILRNVADTRSDDKLLYYYVLREERFSLCISLESYLLGTGKYPNYDSITRVRRKLQEKYPELRPAKNEQIRREEAEEDFRAYARGEE